MFINYKHDNDKFDFYFLFLLNEMNGVLFKKFSGLYKFIILNSYPLQSN